VSFVALGSTPKKPHPNPKNQKPKKKPKPQTPKPPTTPPNNKNHHKNNKKPPKKKTKEKKKKTKKTQQSGYLLLGLDAAVPEGSPGKDDGIGGRLHIKDVIVSTAPRRCRDTAKSRKTAERDLKSMGGFSGGAIKRGAFADRRRSAEKNHGKL